MRALLFCLLLFWPTTALAVSGQLGTPLELRLALPGPGMQLRGLPDLGGLRLLEPPRINADGCTLKLLPLRPGEQTLPPLSFLTADHRLWQSQPLQIEIKPPPGNDAEPAGFKEFPLPPKPGPHWSPWLWLLLPLLVVPLLLLRRRPTTAEPAPPTSSDLLKQLETRLATLESESAAGLRRRCQQLRFAPGGFTTGDVADLVTAVEQLASATVGSR